MALQEVLAPYLLNWEVAKNPCPGSCQKPTMGQACITWGSCRHSTSCTAGHHLSFHPSFSTWLDSNSFCPLCKCLAIPSVSPPLACRLEVKDSIFIAWRINLLPSSSSPSYPQFLISSFPAFPVSWGRLLGEACRVCCGCFSSPCMGLPCSSTPSTHVCFCLSSGSFPSIPTWILLMSS